MSIESMSLDPYESVLADLKAKRAQLDQAIAAIEAIRSGAPMAGAVAAPSVPPDAPLDSPGGLLGLTITDAAKKLLASRRQPMRNPDIAAAFKAGGLVMTSADPVNTIGSVLTRRFNEVGDIVKIGRGTWGLKEWYPNRSFRKEKAEAAEPKSEPVAATVKPAKTRAAAVPPKS